MSSFVYLFILCSFVSFFFLFFFFVYFLLLYPWSSISPLFPLFILFGFCFLSFLPSSFLSFLFACFPILFFLLCLNLLSVFLPLLLYSALLPPTPTCMSTLVTISETKSHSYRTEERLNPAWNLKILEGCRFSQIFGGGNLCGLVPAAAPEGGSETAHRNINALI